MEAIGDMDDDARLMQQVGLGDDAAFEELMNRHKRPLIRFIYRIVHNESMAEELAQDAFVRVYLHREKYRPQAKFSTWLFTIATNNTIKFLRKEKRWVHMDDAKTASGAPAMECAASQCSSAAERVQEEEMAVLVRRALSKLPVQERTAIVLRKYQDCSYQEIADVMKCSLGAIKTYIHRGKLRLKEILTKMERSLDPASTERQV